MSELYNQMLKMQEDTLKSMEIDEDTIDKTYGFCVYCEGEELREILEQNQGLCGECFKEGLQSWRGVK